MRLTRLSLSFFIALTVNQSLVFASPLVDQQQIYAFYQTVFPQLPFKDYADGVYAIDADAKTSWLAINEFPPYEFELEEGKALFQKAFNNGKHYADCFSNEGIAIAQLYPQWNIKTQSITTLATAINDCRIANHAEPLKFAEDEITKITAYMAYTSRGQKINTVIPSDPAALTAYELGKTYFYQRRGQLNFSCASCHVQNAGKFIRSEILSPALGHTTHWPAYRLKTGKLGSLHRRFIVCNTLIRAPIDKAQSPALRQLEFFLSNMSNGLTLNGPSVRK